MIITFHSIGNGNELLLAAVATNENPIDVDLDIVCQASEGANLVTELTSADLEFTIYNKPLLSVFEAHQASGGEL
jgi:hypothetical protein